MSSDSSIAEVDQNGVVVPRKPGIAKIVASTSATVKAECTIKVVKPCTKIVSNPSPCYLAVGETAKPVLTMQPNDSNDDIISFTSDDPSIATVDQNGAITAKAVAKEDDFNTGTFSKTIITVKTFSGYTERIPVTVFQPLSGITLSDTTKSIYAGSSFTLQPNFLPANAYNKKITWTTSNPAVATVSETGDRAGSVVVTGVHGGLALIMATPQGGGQMVYCLVNVEERVTTVTVSPKTYYLKLGSSFTVKAVVNNPTATNKGVTWKSSKTSVATVSTSGKVTSKKLGTTYVRATAKDGSGKYDECKVIVVRKVTSIRLNKYSATVLVGKTLQLYKYISPSNATVKSCTWSSSNNSIATVSSSGKVLALKAGLVKIKCTANDGSGKSATCLVRVKTPVAATGVSVGKSELIVAKGRKIPSGIAISPSNSTNTLKYYSDDKYVATVDKHGKIYCKRTGQVTIYGITNNGKEGFVDVLVVGINRGSLTMRQYDSQTLWVNEMKTGVTWYSSNPLVASVSNGKVIGRRQGRTTIYAVVRGVRLSCRVNIKKLR
jgi:uncharacterized protein YjdB